MKDIPFGAWLLLAVLTVGFAWGIFAVCVMPT